jgi:hypothetical protein
VELPKENGFKAQLGLKHRKYYAREVKEKGLTKQRLNHFHVMHNNQICGLEKGYNASSRDQVIEARITQRNQEDKHVVLKARK